MHCAWRYRTLWEMGARPIDPDRDDTVARPAPQGMGDELTDDGEDQPRDDADEALGRDDGDPDDREDDLGGDGGMGKIDTERLDTLHGQAGEGITQGGDGGRPGGAGGDELRTAFAAVSSPPPTVGLTLAGHGGGDAAAGAQGAPSDASPSTRGRRRTIAASGLPAGGGSAGDEADAQRHVGGGKRQRADAARGPVRSGGLATVEEAVDVDLAAAIQLSLADQRAARRGRASPSPSPASKRARALGGASASASSGLQGAIDFDDLARRRGHHPLPRGEMACDGSDLEEDVFGWGGSLDDVQPPLREGQARQRQGLLPQPTPPPPPPLPPEQPPEQEPQRPVPKRPRDSAGAHGGDGAAPRGVRPRAAGGADAEALERRRGQGRQVQRVEGNWGHGHKMAFRGHYAWCVVCGRYAITRVGAGLASTCKGPAVGAYRRYLVRLAEGLHPLTGAVL